MLKFSASMILSFITLSVFAQSADQIEIQELQKVRSEASRAVKDFRIEEVDLGVGAPDYIHARKILQRVLSEKPHQFEKYLSKLNSELSEDYNIVKNIKNLDKKKATRATYEVARKRFGQLVESKKSSYHQEIKSFVAGDLDKAYNACMTVLCLNRIKVDIENWMKHASKMNKDINLKEAKLRKWDKKVLKEEKQKLFKKIDEKQGQSVLVLKEGEKECENLSDPNLTTDDILKFGTKLIAALGKDKLEEDEKKKRHLEALFAKSSLTKMNNGLEEGCYVKYITSNDSPTLVKMKDKEKHVYSRSEAYSIMVKAIIDGKCSLKEELLEEAMDINLSSPEDVWENHGFYLAAEKLIMNTPRDKASYNFENCKLEDRSLLVNDSKEVLGWNGYDNTYIKQILIEAFKDKKCKIKPSVVTP